MRRIVRKLVQLGLMGLLGCLYASAAMASDAKAELERQISSHSQKLRTSIETYKADPELLAQDVELGTYLGDSLWAVYNGLVLYKWENSSLPTDTESLAGSKYVPVWPLNPFNAFEPVQILELSEGFSAGDMTLQICPPEYYSRISNPRPLSFELSIFGPSEEYGNRGSAQITRSNTWAVVPSGALYMLGARTQSAASAKANAEKRKAEADKAEAEKSETENKSEVQK
jgi:hypothetical protein